MHLDAARRLSPRRRRTDKWLFIVIALGIFGTSGAQRSLQRPRPAAIRDFSQFYNLQAAGTNDEPAIDTASDEGSVEDEDEDEGFVEPLDFSALLGAHDTGAIPPARGFIRQTQAQGTFGAQNEQYPESEKQGAFGDKPLPAFEKYKDDVFHPQNFIKSKGPNQQKSFVFFEQGPRAPLKLPTKTARQNVRKAKQQAEETFDEDEGFENPETEDEPLFVNEEESAENGRIQAAAAPKKRRAKENRYPKYSSYYHAVPARQTQEKQIDDDADDVENPFASVEEDGIGVKVDDSEEDEEPDHQQQIRTKYAAAYTSPKNARPLASNTNQKKAAYSNDPFFEDPPDFPVIQIPSNGKAKSGALRKETAATGYVDRSIRPASTKYGNFEKIGRKPFRPSPPDPLYSKAVASVPSYDYDHSPSAEYHEANFKPKRIEYARSASLSAPIHDGRQSASNKKANCKKVEKQIMKDPDGRFRRDAMTCFVCDDPTSGGTYEQCAYGSEPKTQAYYVGRSQQFRSADKEKPFTYRQRRYLKYTPYPSLPAATPDLPKEDGALKRQTRQEHDEGFPDGFSYDPDSILDDREDYRFGPEYFTQDGDSETQVGESAQLKAAESTKADTPDNCEKVTKGNMVCMVCKESKNGGNYEQCAYGSEPKSSSYSYGKTKSYGTPKKAYTERHRRYIAKGNGASKQPKEKFEKELPPKRKRSEDAEDETHSGVEEDLPKEIAENTEPITGEVEISENVPRKGDSEFDFEEFEKKPEISAKTSDSEGKQSQYDDYFSFLFPEYSKSAQNVKKAAESDDPFDHDDDDHYPAESKDLTTDFLVPNFFSSAEPNKKDLEKMLGEFTQKDRSECKKVMKDQMTCFQCVDAKGMQQEECMFVAASEPKTSHLAYHESKEFKATEPKTKDEGTTKTPGNDSSALPTAGTKTSLGSTTTTKPAFRSRGSKKHESVTTTSTAAPSTTAAPEKARKRETKVLSRRTRGVEPVQKKEEQAEESELEVEEEVPETEDVEAGSAAVAATAAEALSSGETPAEFKVPEGPEGMYSEDTKPVFDKTLQVTLPKYMLSKSEHEAIFDEVLASGS